MLRSECLKIPLVLERNIPAEAAWSKIQVSLVLINYESGAKITVEGSKASGRPVGGSTGHRVHVSRPSQATETRSGISDSNKGWRWHLLIIHKSIKKTDEWIVPFYSRKRKLFILIR